MSTDEFPDSLHLPISAMEETVAKVNSLTILLARLSRSRIPKATQRFAFMQQSHRDVDVLVRYNASALGALVC